MEIEKLTALLEALKSLNKDRQGDRDTSQKGEYVICRCSQAGVHAGILEWRSGQEVSLKESRRLWRWKPKEGHAFLSGVAISGLCASESKIGAPIDLILTEVCEVIATSEEARQSITSAETYQP